MRPSQSFASIFIALGGVHSFGMRGPPAIRTTTLQAPSQVALLPYLYTPLMFFFACTSSSPPLVQLGERKSTSTCPCLLCIFSSSGFLFCQFFNVTQRWVVAVSTCFSFSSWTRVLDSLSFRRLSSPPLPPAWFGRRISYNGKPNVNAISRSQLYFFPLSLPSPRFRTYVPPSPSLRSLRPVLSIE